MSSRTVLRRLAIAGMATLAAATAAVAIPEAASAATSMRGRVVCGANSQGRFVGMWVSTNAGGNGWASWTATSDPMIANYAKSIPSNATSISVAVGCGGSPASWARTYYGTISVGTGNFTLGKDWICFTYGANVCV